MIRLCFAGALAVAIHAAVLLTVPYHATAPTVILPRSKSVAIDLKASVPKQKPARPLVKKPVSPPVKPKPVLKPKPAPATRKIPPAPKKPAPQKPTPRPEPKPIPAATPMPTRPPSDIVTPEPEALPLPEPKGSADMNAPPPAPSARSGMQAVDERQPETSAVRIAVPQYDRNPHPEYPRLAKRRGYQGTVLLDVLVTEKGMVAEVDIAKSSGHSVLDRSAMKAVKRWTFEPAHDGTSPVQAWVKVPVRFALR